ncbi:MAG: AIM24 family protein [Ktedonobacteraceae bacterium]|nr:AIM24 family protein [Ktedonobacteraceae bacterium]
MICPRCNSQVADGVKFCGSCGATLQGTPPPPPRGYPPPPQQGGYPSSPQQGGYPPPPQQGAYTPPNQYEEYSGSTLGNAIPRAELHNPKGPLRVADMTINIEGELVPVVDIMLGNQMPIYFEHHILLWKHPGVQINFKSLNNAARRFFAGLQIFMTEAYGPGNISFSRDSVGQIVALRLQPGQTVEVREHQFLVASGNVDYDFTFVQGAANILFSRTGLFIDRFTAMGGEGILLLHGYGNVFEKTLAPGEALDIEPGAWLWKDPSVQMTVTTVAGSQRGGGIFGAIAGFVAGASIIMNRFIGPGRVGIQSMTYHPPTAEGSPQAGGQSNLNLGDIFNN